MVGKTAKKANSRWRPKLQGKQIQDGGQKVKRKQIPRRWPTTGSDLHEVNKLAGSCHRHGLDVGRHIAEDGEQAVEERLQTVMPTRDNLINAEKAISRWRPKLQRKPFNPN